jgi:type IX secretion system PorP/SprF family membrane protein
MNFKKIYLVLLLFISQISLSQEGISVYSDYLSDNYYLLHPSMAGAASCDKVRLTARQQWFGQEDAPSMQTLSYNARVSEKSGLGGIVYNDRNGYHSQKGIKVTYAHHLSFSRDGGDLNQLSFGMSLGLVQSVLDQTKFLGPFDYDPIVDGTVQQDSYANVDVGMSYNYHDFYVHGTVKNAIETRRQLYTDVESDNIKKYIINAGYVFGNEYSTIKLKKNHLMPI